MKNYTINFNGTAMTFSVDEDWLSKVSVPAVGNPEDHIFNRAMADPEQSGITTDNNAMNESLENVKKLVARAKEINADNGSDVRIMVEKPNVYMVKFAGQIYSSNLSIKEVDNALTKIKAYLDHENLIKVRIFPASGKTDLQRAMDLEAWIAKNTHKVISVCDNGTAYTLVYIEKRCGTTTEEADDFDF